MSFRPPDHSIVRGTVDDGNAHVYPCFPGEREHVMSIDCWCRPRRDLEMPNLIIHERRAEA